MGNVKPKKNLGQHFLRDHNIARKIANCIAYPDGEPVVEIGPGMGMLTQYLLENTTDLIVVEFDHESVEYLESNFPQDHLRIVGGDFLRWNLQTELKAPAHFIGNLPYNVSSPIFFHLLENLEQVLTGVFMVQKEVAERICSGPGNKTYGILSVLMGYYFELNYEFTVSEKVFLPPPKVKSAVFSMRKKPDPGPVPFSTLARVVKAAFGKRRKTMRNALKGMDFSDFPEKEEWMALRAEQLSIEQFGRLAEYYEGS